MTVMLDIARFELRRLFVSPLAWLIFASVQFILAMFFYMLLSRYLGQPAAFSGRGMTEIVVAGFYQGAGVILMLITPFVTMRSVSEDRRTGTIHLLLSSPLSITQMVAGKYLGIMLFMLCLLGVVSLMPASLALGTGLDYGQFLCAIAGMTLLLGTFSAAGLFVSTLFRHTAATAVGTFALLFGLWTIHAAATGGGSLDPVFNYLSLLRHFNTLTGGIVNSVDVLYFILLAGTFILLSIWRLDALRTHHW
jgi:ABC-2 type transport system permease protein